MTTRRKYQIINYLIAGVWLANGLLCKVFNFVPRHQQIVARILGDEHARAFTLSIGLAETAMAFWILSDLWPGMNAIVQIIIIATMNTLEFILVPDLLLWGRLNALFAFLFILLIYYKEFYLTRKLTVQP